MDATTTLTYTLTREHKRVISLNTSPHTSHKAHGRSHSNLSTIADTAGITSELNNKHEYLSGAYNALAPIGISFHNPDRSIYTNYVEPEVFAAARRYLRNKLNVTIIHVLGPWLVLGCKPSVPSGRMPGIAGGFLAIWRPASNISFNPFIGEHSKLYKEGWVLRTLIVAMAAVIWDAQAGREG